MWNALFNVNGTGRRMMRAALYAGVLTSIAWGLSYLVR
jgi:hypothetical protein